MNKKSITRKLIMSISTAAMTAICLGTTTYAWFSQNRNVWVENTDLYVDSYDGLLISLDGKNFSQDISADELKMYITNKDNAEDAREAYKSVNLVGNTMEQDDDGEILKDDDGIVFGHDAVDHVDNKYTNTIKLYDQNSDLLVAYLVVETENDEVISFKAFDNEDNELVVDDTNKATGQYIISDEGSNTIATLTNFNVNSYVRENLVAKQSESQNYRTIISYVDSGYSHKTVESVANSNYLKFDLYFRIVSDINSGADHEDYELKFTENTYLKSEEIAKDILVNNMVAGENGYLAGQEIEFDVANAMRVAVDSKDALNIFEVVNDKDLGSVAIEGSDDIKHDKNKNAMYTYYNSLHPNYVLDKAATDGKRFITNSEYTSVSLGKFEYDDQNGKYNDLKTTVYIWLEGWDADYFLGASVNSRKLNIKLDFKYKDED